MYEETVAGLRRIINNHKGRLTPFMRVTICEAIEAIEELSHENESLAKSVNEASEILRKRWMRLPDQPEEVLK